MRQRGRKSAAQLSVVPVVAAELPTPPARLSSAEKKVWRDVVALFPAHQFMACLPLLEAYCGAVVMERDLAAQLRDLDLADKRYGVLAGLLRAARASAAKLAGALRLTPRSTWSRATPQLITSHRRPWDIGDEHPVPEQRRDFARELAEVRGQPPDEPEQPEPPAA
jgi:hypothetical protein